MLKTTPRLELVEQLGTVTGYTDMWEVHKQLSGGLSGMKKETIGFGKIWALTQTLCMTRGILSELQNLSVLLYF